MKIDLPTYFDKQREAAKLNETVIRSLVNTMEDLILACDSPDVKETEAYLRAQSTLRTLKGTL